MSQRVRDTLIEVPRPEAVRLLQWVLGITIVMAVVTNGALQPLAQLMIHLLLVLGCVVAAALPGSTLAKGGRSLRMALAPGWILMAGLLTLLPVPGSWLWWLAPGTQTVWGPGWHPASMSPANTLGALSTLSWAPSMLALAVLAIRPRRGGRVVQHTAAIAICGLFLLAMAQRLAETDLLYGLIPIESGIQPWAPLVNGNFDAFLVAGLMAMMLPALIRWRRERAVWLVVMTLALLLGLMELVAVGAAGAWFGLSLACVYAGLRAAFPRRRGVAAAAVLAVLTAALAALWATLPGSSELDPSIPLRLDQWQRSAALLADHLWLGVGPGGYGTAFPPYQDPWRFTRFDHAHSDPLQFVVEHGLVGLIAMAALILTLPTADRRELSHPASGLELALVAWLAHCAVDFPLQLPGVALLVWLVLAVRLTRWQSPTQANPMHLRGLFIALAASQMLGGAWATHQVWLGTVIPGLRDASDDQVAAVSRWAAWRPEPYLELARRAAVSGQLESARIQTDRATSVAPYDASVWTQAGAVHATLRDLEHARELLDHAMQRSSADPRPRALSSRVAQAQGDDEAAIELWVEALRRWPYADMVASRPFQRALSLQPTGLYWVDRLDDTSHPWTLVELGNELLFRDDPESAWLAYEQAARLDPSLRWNPQLGLALVRTGQVEAGLQQLLAADAYDDDGRARRLRARALDELGRLAEAKPDALAALQEDRSSTEAQLLALRATAASETPDAALKLANHLHPEPSAAPETFAVSAAAIAHDAALWGDCLQWLDRPLTQAGAEVLKNRCTQACPLCRRSP